MGMIGHAFAFYVCVGKGWSQVHHIPILTFCQIIIQIYIILFIILFVILFIILFVGIYNHIFISHILLHFAFLIFSRNIRDEKHIWLLSAFDIIQSRPIFPWNLQFNVRVDLGSTPMSPNKNATFRRHLFTLTYDALVLIPDSELGVFDPFFRPCQKINQSLENLRVCGFLENQKIQ